MLHVLEERGERLPPHGIAVDHQDVGRVEGGEGRTAIDHQGSGFAGAGVPHRRVDLSNLFGG